MRLVQRVAGKHDHCRNGLKIRHDLHGRVVRRYALRNELRGLRVTRTWLEALGRERCVISQHD